MGEDITDFFTKYNKTKTRFNKLYKSTPLFEPTADPVDVVPENLPIVDLYKHHKKHVDQLVQSNIQVVAVSETAYRVPSSIMGTKTKLADGVANSMVPGSAVFWELQNKKLWRYIILNG